MFITSTTSSDVPESHLPSHSHEPLESQASRSHLKIFESSRSRSMTWSNQVRVDLQELSRHFESLISKLESITIQIKFNIFCYKRAPNELQHDTQCGKKWCPIFLVAILIPGYLELRFFVKAVSILLFSSLSIISINLVQTLL